MKNKKQFEKFTIYTLSNDTKILIYPQNHVNSVSIQAILRAGHLSEKVEENGIAHLLEHMILDGTESYPNYKSLNMFFDKIAGDYTAATSENFVTVYGNFVDEEIQNALKVLHEILFKPKLNKTSFKKEKSVILDELQTYEDNLEYKSFIEAKKNRFDKNTILSKPLGGNSDTLEKITHKQIQDFHQKYYQPQNLNLVIVGNCNEKETINTIENIFSNKNKTQLKHKSFSTDLYSGRKINLYDKESLKSYIRITFPSYSWKDKIDDRVAVSFLGSLLTNKRNSLLYSKLREEMGLIYSINMNTQSSFEVGVLEIATSTPLDHSLTVIEEILKTLAEVKESLFEEDKLEMLKEIDRKRIKMIFDTSSGIMNWLGRELIFRYPKIYLPEDIKEIYKLITINKLRQTASEIFDLSKININVLQPFEDKTSYKNKLTQLLNE